MIVSISSNFHNEVKILGVHVTNIRLIETSNLILFIALLCEFIIKYIEYEG